MTAVAKTMKDDDMRGFADFIGTLPPVPAPPPATPPDAARMKKGAGAGAAAQVLLLPRRRLRRRPAGAAHRRPARGIPADELQGFKSGKRPGYTMAMGEAVSQIAPEDLDTLAYFAAHFSGSAPGK